MQQNETKDDSDTQYTKRMDTLSYIFKTPNNKNNPDKFLIKRMTEMGFDKNRRLTNLGNQYHLHMKLFYNLQRYNEENNLKNFALVPMFKHKRQHIRYDNFGLLELLRETNKGKKGKDKTTYDNTLFMKNSKSYWKEFFPYKRFETATHKFDSMITTDGVSCEFLMYRNKEEETVAGRNSLSKSRETRKEEKQKEIDSNKAKFQQRFEQGFYWSRSWAKVDVRWCNSIRRSIKTTITRQIFWK